MVKINPVCGYWEKKQEQMSINLDLFEANISKS